jgi:glycine/D-amino acid oxidase-like deaminating enzyme/nitrite reductase/ring-hydroxylating ferredoxin subunit
MKRDGAKVSLWQATDAYQPSFREPLKDSRYDVIIVGGGMTGVLTAFLLQQEGKKCLLLEAGNLAFGTTGGTTAHLNTLLDTPYSTIANNFGKDASRTVANAASQAIRLIEDNIRSLNIECEFSRAYAYLFSQNEEETEELKKITNAAIRAGLETTYTMDLPIPVAFEKAVRFSDQAKFHPVHYLHGIAAEFERLGGHIHDNCRVMDVKENTEFLAVATTRGMFTAARLIYATHIPPGVNILHLRCSPWRSYAMAVKLANHDFPDALIYDMKDPYYYYRTQRIGEQSYLICGGEDHKTGAEVNAEHSFLKLRAHIQRIFNVQEVTHEWSSQYFESADGLPYIGILPGDSENIYVATGYGGNGMIYSHVAAREISHHILTGKSYYDNLFSPSRIKPIAGFTNFVAHNADVVRHFVGKWFGVEQIDELAELAPGDGKVVTIDNTRIALSKDIDGNVHAVSPVCTHLKCNVSWNNAERSWDCPCHGARYSADGVVLTGPADHDLEKIELREPIDPSQPLAINLTE